MIRFRLLLSPLLALIFGVSAAAQFKPANPNGSQAETPSGQPTFSIGVNLVRLLVSVRDAKGILQTNLNKDQFRILDCEVPQQIAVFEKHTSLPLSVAILVDTSASTETDLHYEEESVSRFIPALLNAGNPDDTFALFSFNWRTSMEADYGRNQHRAEKALHSLRGEGGTSLYDAVYLASDTLTGREGRHAMIIVTDGGDTTSYKKYSDALDAAQRADVVIYPIVVIPIPGDAGRNIGGEHALATLAASTGGRIFYPDGFDKLDVAFSGVINELRTQYLLGYYPHSVTQGTRGYHPVKVQLADPSLKVTARSGYYEP
jgi:Ca-activated chloride channel family protein